MPACRKQPGVSATGRPGWRCWSTWPRSARGGVVVDPDTGFRYDAAMLAKAIKAARGPWCSWMNGPGAAAAVPRADPCRTSARCRAGRDLGARRRPAGGRSARSGGWDQLDTGGRNRWRISRLAQ